MNTIPHPLSSEEREARRRRIQTLHRGEPSLHLVDGRTLWLDVDGMAETGLAIGGGESPEEAIADGVRTLENVLAALRLWVR